MKTRLPACPAIFLTGALAQADVVNPPPGYRPPVIAKVEIVFSMVAHHHHIPDRVQFYDNHGDPPGNSNYAVPLLVYEPLVTLYNPYDEELDMSPRGGPRIRIWDPPVGFRFKKGPHYLRPEWSAGEYHGLARFQIANEKNHAARKTFTLYLNGDESGTTPSFVTLPAGTSRTFAARVEPNWTWGFETSGYSARAFHDWDVSRDFTNRDTRPYGSTMGVVCVPHWDVRAGFQTDQLSYSTTRPEETIYPFEKNSNIGSASFVTMKITDQVTVEAAPVRTVWNPDAADFQVDLMGGRIEIPSRDTYQQLRFDLDDLVAHGDPAGAVPAAIERAFQVGDLLQTANDLTSGGKTPFAILSIVAKPEALTSGALLELETMDASGLYDFRFDEMTSFASRESINLLEPPTEVKIQSARRAGDTMVVNFSGLAGVSSWRVMGGTDVAALEDDLTAESAIVAGPDGSGLVKAFVEVGERGPRYFIRFEADEP